MRGAKDLSLVSCQFWWCPSFWLYHQFPLENVALLLCGVCGPLFHSWTRRRESASMPPRPWLLGTIRRIGTETNPNAETLGYLCLLYTEVWLLLSECLSLSHWKKTISIINDYMTGTWRNLSIPNMKLYNCIMCTFDIHFSTKWKPRTNFMSGWSG